MLRAVASVQKSHEGFRVEEFGTASFGKAANDSAGKDFSHAEIFGSLSTVSMKEIGVGLAVAVLIDAIIVRAILLPER